MVEHFEGIVVTTEPLRGVQVLTRTSVGPGHIRTRGSVPLWDRHRPGRIGHIDEIWIDDEARVVRVRGRITSPAHARAVAARRLTGLSIGGEVSQLFFRDPDTRQLEAVCVNKTTIIEVSLCETPALPGCQITWCGSWAAQAHREKLRTRAIMQIAAVGRGVSNFAIDHALSTGISPADFFSREVLCNVSQR